MWFGGKQRFFGPLSHDGAPAVAERHLCRAGGDEVRDMGFTGGQPNIMEALQGTAATHVDPPGTFTPFGLGKILSQMPIYAFSAAAAPFTGGASLALPFAMHAGEDAITGDWGALPGQAVGDALSAVGGYFGGPGINEFFGPGGAATNFLTGASDFLGGGAAAAAPNAALGMGAGPITDLGSWGVPTDLGSWAGTGADAAAIGGGSVAGAAALGAGLGGSGFGGGYDGSEGNFTMPTTPSVAPLPGSSAGGEMGPIGGGGGSAYAAADPYGAGGPVGGGMEGTASGSATAGYTGFGDPTTGASSAPAVTGGQPMTQADYGALANPQAAGAASPNVSTTMAGAGLPSGAGGLGGIADFLKQNRDLISLGMGGLGVGNAIWKNSQMQGGIDALIQQSRQAQMFMSQFQHGYQQLIDQAIPLIQQGANGQINPGQAASLLQSANRMKTEIRAKYASMGGAGGQNGTNLQQDLNNVDNVISSLRQAMAMGQLEAGVRLAGGAGGFGGLNAGALSSIGQFARLNAASDQELVNALGGFAKAATSFGS